MLLFIPGRICNLSNQHNFNTSHVTVYRRKRNFRSAFVLFQYISCYCLSPLEQVLKNKHKRISIHLMLLFIDSKFIFNVRKNFISIHLMLLFILEGLLTSQNWSDFNTSHVTVYRMFYCKDYK